MGNGWEIERRSGFRVSDKLCAIINPERDGMAVKKGNAELVRAVNQALAKILSDGRYEKLSLRYFGKDIRCR